METPVIIATSIACIGLCLILIYIATAPEDKP